MLSAIRAAWPAQAGTKRLSCPVAAITAVIQEVVERWRAGELLDETHPSIHHTVSQSGPSRSA
jgi:hypothetical protein